VNAKTRWILLALFVCATTLIVIDSGAVKRIRGTEPGRLPEGLTSVREGDAPGLRRLPTVRHDEASLTPASHLPLQSTARAASYSIAAPVIVALNATGAANEPILISDVVVANTALPNLTWPVTSNNDPPILVRSTTIKIQLPASVSGKIRIVRKDNGTEKYFDTSTKTFGAVTATTAIDAQSLSSNDMPLAQGASTQLVVKKVGAGANAETDPTQDSDLTSVSKLVVQTPSVDDVAPPKVTHVAHSSHADSSVFSGAPAKLYGQSPYIRLEGQNYLRGTAFKFFQTTPVGGKVRLKEIGKVEFRTPSQPESAWTAEFQVSGPPPASGSLLVLSLSADGSKHNYSSNVGYTIETAAVLAKVDATKVTVKVGSRDAKKEKDVHFANQTTLTLTGQDDVPVAAQVVAYRGNDPTPVGKYANDTGVVAAAPWTMNVSGLSEDRQELYLVMEQGDEKGDPSDPVTIAIQKRGPRVLRVEPSNFGTAPGFTALTVFFSERNPLQNTPAIEPANYTLLRSNGTGVFDRGTETLVSLVGGTAAKPNPTYDRATNSVHLTYTAVVPDVYELTVKGAGILDLYGNPLEGVPDKPSTDYVKPLGKVVTAQDALANAPSVRPGISGETGEYVTYPEFTKPRKVPDGFNPHDKVETRVARLYYYRDAHRVAQIVNRKVQSHNRQGVDMSRQLADKARSLADQTTESRKESERTAIIKAQETRRIENQLRAAEQRLNRSVQELTNLRRQTPQPDNAEDIAQQLEAAIRTFSNQVTTLRGEVEDARSNEIQANELVQQLEGKERLAREDQFRREVAAAHADPDTYAEGLPKSKDPVEQVSISVIGEGLIHLRGPLKGINTIRTMIDQIDQPVGQVRVSVHSVQINGEREERMEDVANVVQLHIDQARFLTMQSSEMLRKAVVQVASRKAEESMMLYPGDSQEDRDRRYLYAFFGKEFIDELAAMDSEFLKTGNKLLSLHSMDTTSLSSALNLLALAKNSTRMEILEEFQQMTQGELPIIEASYLEAGMTACKKKFDFRCPPKFYPLAERARFESLRGFFNSQIAHDDTLTPLQREFIRLAQIFKGRLITELEYKQRVMERAMIEERIPSQHFERLQEAAEQEQAARRTSLEARLRLPKQRNAVLKALNAAVANSQYITDTVGKAAEEVRSQFEKHVSAYQEEQQLAAKVRLTDEENERKRDAQKRLNTTARAEVQSVIDAFDIINWFKYTGPRKEPFHRIRKVAKIDLGQIRDFEELKTELQKTYPAREYPDGPLKPLDEDVKLISESIRDNTAALKKQADDMTQRVSDSRADVRELQREWLGLYRSIEEKLWINQTVEDDTIYGAAKQLRDLEEQLREATKTFDQLLTAWLEIEAARERAEIATRPLDHKKFLNMLIDDLEEKYIELLDGTRAHTANVDNYLKRLTTALDDDFNTQFYHPAFRYIREASTYHDVQFGQTETTSILANNRAFAKVDPSASMEFDLPARDIMLAEAMNGAKAMIDDVGALANDPTFLAMAKSRTNSGANPSPGSTGGFGVVRDVLPGLSSTTAEQVMAHNAGARPQFGSNLENLIPDPAIYKFETGTGYEIRPVIQPDGQAVVFDFDYMYTTNVREPVRADEKHLGRVKRHFVHTDVQLSNFELREVSRYTVALKAARTSRGVPLLEDIPLAGALFRPLPSDESSLQQNLIYSQATIFPTLFDLMGLRWAPAVADMDPLRVSNREFIVRGRHRALENRVYDYASEQVDEFLRIPEANRRADLYRTQETIPYMHPNGYQGPGLDLRDSQLQEGYQPGRAYPQNRFIPSESKEGSPLLPRRGYGSPRGTHTDGYPLEEVTPGERDPEPITEPERRSTPGLPTPATGGDHIESGIHF